MCQQELQRFLLHRGQAPRHAEQLLQPHHQVIPLEDHLVGRLLNAAVSHPPNLVVRVRFGIGLTSKKATPVRQLVMLLVGTS